MEHTRQISSVLLVVALESVCFMHSIFIDSILFLIQSIQYGGCRLHSVFAITMGNRVFFFVVRHFLNSKSRFFSKPREEEKGKKYSSPFIDLTYYENHHHLRGEKWFFGSMAAGDGCVFLLFHLYFLFSSIHVRQKSVFLC